MSSLSAPVALAAQLALLSLISFGGIPTILPDIHNLVVVTKGWVSWTPKMRQLAKVEPCP
jgi:chromate transport protein ChrA